MKISEAQAFVREMLKVYNVRKASLASLAGVVEEIGELASDLLARESYKTKSTEVRLDYRLAEVFFELLKLAEDCNVDLEKAFIEALERWKDKKPHGYELRTGSHKVVEQAL